MHATLAYSKSPSQIHPCYNRDATRLNLPVLTGNCLEEARQDFDNLVLERTVGNSGVLVVGIDSYGSLDFCVLVLPPKI